MGRFSKGENVYIMAKIVDIDAEDTTKYLMKTKLAKFYATEAGDTIRSNPAEVYTAPELFALCKDIANMSTEDLAICFGEGYTGLEDVILSDMSITEIREKFVEWQYGNLISVSDMVYYNKPNAENPILCSVIGIIEGDTPDTATDNTYSIYSDEENTIYTATRDEITSAHKRSREITQSLTDLKDATKKAREEIG